MQHEAYILCPIKVRGSAWGCEGHRALRGLAKSIAESIKSPVFSMFMNVEEATQSKRYMIGEGEIADLGIQKNEINKVRTGFWNYEVNQELALSALGIEKKFLSYKDTHFLWKTNLFQLLRHHQISIPAELTVN